MIYDDKHIESLADKLKNGAGESSTVSSFEYFKALLKSADCNDEARNDSEKKLLEAFSDLRLKLAEHMKLDNVLFLFGNGASMYAGSKNTQDFKLGPLMAEYPELSYVSAKINEQGGIEEQLNALITVKAYYHLVKDEVKERQITALINEVKSELIASYVNSVDYNKLNLHEIFLRKLRAFGCLKRTEIYTSNYDLAFEYSLDKLSIEYVDGFSGFVNRVFNPRTLQEKDRTSLVKIHGSLNWCYENKVVKEFQPRFADGKVKIDDTAPVLIYPTSNKLYQTYSTPYSELMRHMLDEMSTGRNVIIVLGYKYGDEHINEILLKAMENPNDIFYFFLYSPDEEGGFIGQIRKLAESMPNINLLTGHILADFKNFVKYILPATPEKTDQEKAIDLLQKVLVNHAE